jgi:hypothetical protein
MPVTISYLFNLGPNASMLSTRQKEKRWIGHQVKWQSLQTEELCVHQWNHPATTR